MGGISIWQLLIIAVIVVLLFGTKKLRNIGGDLGGALKGFKKAMADDTDDIDKTTKVKTDSLAEKNTEAESVTTKDKDQA